MTEYQEMADALDWAADYLCDELGEWWKSLAYLCPRVFDAATPEFLEAYKLQLVEAYASLQYDFRLEETTITFTRDCVDLVYKYDI